MFTSFYDIWLPNTSQTQRNISNTGRYVGNKSIEIYLKLTYKLNILHV